MYKILNFKLLKQLLSYFIICLLIGFAFQSVASVNEMLYVYPLKPIDDLQDYLVLCSRLIMMLSIVLFLHQDFMDLYGAKFIFIQIRKSDNKHYFYYILFKEFISLILFSFVYVVSLSLTMILTDHIDPLIFFQHYLGFVMGMWNLFLVSIFLTTIFSEHTLYYLLLGVFFIYTVVYSSDYFISLLDVLYSYGALLIAQMLFSFLLMNRIYYKQCIRR